MNNSSANQPVSLFASCMTLIEKLYSFPLFEFYLFPEGTSMFTDPDNPAMIEPIEILWGAFRLGAPLCMVYNHLNLTQPLKVSDVSGVRPGQYGKMCKDNVYHFVVACRNELHIAEAMDFIPSELYKNDTHGFMKVLKMVQEIVSRIEQSGNMPPKKPFPIPIPTFESAGTTSDNRSKLIKEMVDTERTYISALDTLQTYMKECEVQRVLSKDLIRLIFANLNDLIDFQRRFVITMESILVMPANEQRIGNLFIQNEENFSVYHSFCSNYNQAVKIVLDETENLKRLSNIIEPIQLQSYLIKPVQRVCRYPLLLQELIKLSDPEKYPYMDELKSGLESIKRVTETLNEESRRQENEQKKFDLRDRIDDWKGLNIDDFGELLLSEKFLMASSDQEREYDLFLFENILLCCKDMQQKAKKKKSTYSVRGNIQITAISRVEDISDASIGYYGIKVYWEDGLESVQFSLKCRNAEQVKLWKDRIDRLV
ncbi:Dbl homology domain-containing protein, partial [Zopfochytrium polystomum]